VPDQQGGLKATWDVAPPHLPPRAQTLDAAPSCERRGAFDRTAYRAYCTAYEDECGTHAGFGPGGNRGSSPETVRPAGSSETFYDYLKDLAPLTDGVAVGRIAIWDSVNASAETELVGRVLERASAGSLDRSIWLPRASRADRGAEGRIDLGGTSD
jgi:hypothetical protein